MISNRPALPPHVGSFAVGHSADLLAAYAEFCRQKAFDPNIDAQRFCDGYPLFRVQLAKLISVDRFVGSQLGLSANVAPTWPELGQTFLGFELEAYLGEGSFARVYRASEKAIGGRRVVLKLTCSGIGEAGILGRAEHPNIAPIHSVMHDEASGLSVLCMKYLGHATLQKWIDRLRADGSTPFKDRVLHELAQDPVFAEQGLSTGGDRPELSYVEAIRLVAIRIADALAFLHQRGITHCDLKPSNILLTPSGQPVLIDFNLSHDRFRNDIENHPGGTLYYMAPEQWKSLEKGFSADGIDGRADLYALGVILYELLTGRHPFGELSTTPSQGGLHEHLRRCHATCHRQVRELNPRVDERFAAAIRHCLAADPAERIASAAELSRLLQPPRHRSRWRWIACANLACLALGATTWLTAFPSEEAFLHRAHAAAQSGDLQEASRLYDEAVRESPNDQEALARRGKVLLQLGKSDPAQLKLATSDFLKAARLEPSGRNKALVGFGYQAQGAQPVALQMYQEAIQLGYAPVEVRNNLGFAAQRTAKFQLAEETLKDVLATHPNYASAHHNLGVLLHQKALQPKGATEPEKKAMLLEGIAHLRRAIELGPVSGDLYRDAMLICTTVSRYDSAWREPALNYLDQAVAHGINPSIYPKNEPYAHLHHLPRFQAICKKTPQNLHLAAGERMVFPSLD